MVLKKGLLVFLAVLFLLPCAFAQDCGLVGYQDVCPDGYVCWGASGSFSGYCKQLGWVQDGGGCDYSSVGVNTVFDDELCVSGHCDNSICCQGEDCCTMNSDCPGWLSRSEECNTATYTCVATLGLADGQYGCWEDWECQSYNCNSKYCCVAGQTCCRDSYDCSSGYQCDYTLRYCVASSGGTPSTPPSGLTLKADGSHCTYDSDCVSGNCNSYGSEDFGPTNGNCCAYGEKCCQEEHDGLIASHYPDMLGKYQCDDSYYYLVRIPGTDVIEDEYGGVAYTATIMNNFYMSSDGVAISCYAEDLTDGSIGGIGNYPSCAFDDSEGESNRYDGIWTGSYTLSDTQICLKVSGLTAPNNPTHDLGVGYTVVLPEGYVSERGVNRENWIIKSYAGNPGGIDEELCFSIGKETVTPVYEPTQSQVVPEQTPQIVAHAVPVIPPAVGLVTYFDAADDEAREVKTLVEDIYPKVVAIFDEGSNQIFTGPRRFRPEITLKMTDDTSAWEESTNTLYIVRKGSYPPMANYPVEAVQKNAIAHELAHYHMNGFASESNGNYRKVPMWFREGIAEYIAHKYYDVYLRASPNDRTVSQHRYDILIGYLTYSQGDNYKENIEERAIEKISWESEGDIDEDLADYDHIYYGAAFSFIKFFLDTFKPTAPEYSSMDLLKLTFMEGASLGFFDDFELYVDAPNTSPDDPDDAKHAWFNSIDQAEGIVAGLNNKPSIGERFIGLLKYIIPFW